MTDRLDHLRFHHHHSDYLQRSSTRKVSAERYKGSCCSNPVSRRTGVLHQRRLFADMGRHRVDSVATHVIVSPPCTSPLGFDLNLSQLSGSVPSLGLGDVSCVEDLPQYQKGHQREATVDYLEHLDSHNPLTG